MELITTTAVLSVVDIAGLNDARNKYCSIAKYHRRILKK